MARTMRRPWCRSALGRLACLRKAISGSPDEGGKGKIPRPGQCFRPLWRQSWTARRPGRDRRYLDSTEIILNGTEAAK